METKKKSATMLFRALVQMWFVPYEDQMEFNSHYETLRGGTNRTFKR
jgi:hypothetical protein